MNTPNFDISADNLTGVLSVLRRGAAVAAFSYGKHDPGVILSLDAAGHVVGLQFDGGFDLTLEFWQKHPDRADLPPDLRDAMDAWYREVRPGLRSAWDEPDGPVLSGPLTVVG